MNDALLSIENLTVSFGKHQALRGVDLTLTRASRLGLVGESGAGKSMVAFAVLNLIAEPGYISGGRILFEGQDLAKINNEAMRRIRGGRIAMIFQDPMMTLNPVLTIGMQMVETLQAHQNISKKQARKIAINRLTDVAIPSPEKRFDSYPHELSGGLRQRVVIAIALLCEPDIIIADEPTTALDVTIQAGIMSLLISLCKKRGLALFLITHDLALVSESCQHLAVLYAGKIIEYGLTQEILKNPRHPYTRGLLDALPQNKTQQNGQKRLMQIPGNMPNIDEMPLGCAFHPRCQFKSTRCQNELPQLGTDNHSRQVACFKPLV